MRKKNQDLLCERISSFQQEEKLNGEMGDYGKLQTLHVVCLYCNINIIANIVNVYN